MGFLDNSSVGVASKCWVRAHLGSAELSLKRMTFINHHCHHTDLLIRLFWVVQNHLAIKINKHISWPGFGSSSIIGYNLFNVIFHCPSFQNPPLQPDLRGCRLTQNAQSHSPPVDGTTYNVIGHPKLPFTPPASAYPDPAPFLSDDRTYVLLLKLRVFMILVKFSLNSSSRNHMDG